MAGDAADAVQAALRERPDVALLDMRMPGSGAAAAWEITARLPGTRAVMLTISRSDEDLFAALRAGASGYLLKDMPFDAHRRRARGRPRGPRRAAARAGLPARRGVPRQRPAPPQVLLGQQRRPAHEPRVAGPRLLRQGCATGDIARRLFVSPATVRSHVAAVLRKLRVPDRESAVRLFEDS